MSVKPYPPTHRYCGSDSERQSVGDPGHCERCAEVGHILAHPDLGCGDVGCTMRHGDEEEAELALQDRMFEARTTLTRRGVGLEFGRSFTLEQVEALAEVVKTWED